MQLKITTDYAIRLLLCLAEQPARKTAEELSERMTVPKPTVIKIMGRLKARGWVAAQEGIYGGYSLATPLQSISLLDIFEAMEETVRINRCLEEDEYCSRFATINCPVRNAYTYLQDIMEELFRSLTLDKVVNGDLSTLDAAHAIACMGAPVGRTSRDTPRRGAKESIRNQA